MKMSLKRRRVTIARNNGITYLPIAEVFARETAHVASFQFRPEETKENKYTKLALLGECSTHREKACHHWHENKTTVQGSDVS